MSTSVIPVAWRPERRLWLRPSNPRPAQAQSTSGPELLRRWVWVEEGGVRVPAGHLTQGAVNSAAQISAALGARGGEAFLGLHQRRTCFSLRTMLLDLRGKGGAPRWAAESPCHKIRGSAWLAGVGLLIALLSALGCCSQAPGRAAKLQDICSWAVLPLQCFGACD